MKIKEVRELPYGRLLKLIQVYILFTLLLFFFGPISWTNTNDGLIAFLVLAYLFAFSLGYKKGAYSSLKDSKHKMTREDNVIKWIKVLVVLSIIYSILYIFRYGKSFSISEIINNTFLNLMNPAQKYAETHSGALEGNQLFGGGFLSLIVTFSGPITIPAIMLPIVYFEKLELRYKILSIFGMVLQFAGKTVVGTNAALFDLGIFVIAAFFIRIETKRKPKNKIRKGNMKTIILIILLLVGLLAFFTNNIGQRTNTTFAFPTIRPNRYMADSAILKFVPQFLHPTLAFLTVYLCEGYYGMSLALQLEWIPTFGAGFSSFIRNNLEELFNINLIQYSYQGRAEVFGWGANRNWHTAYTWFANDVSFIGVIFIMYIIGWLVIRTFRDSVENKNPFAIVLFGILIMQILFLSSNNKIFADSVTFITFWLFLIMWKFTKKFNQYREENVY